MNGRVSQNKPSCQQTKEMGCMGKLMGGKNKADLI